MGAVLEVVSPRRKFLKQVLLAATVAITNLPSFLIASTRNQKKELLSPLLDSVPFIRQRKEWKRFIVLVWQWQNDVTRDVELYKRIGLQGFHIDYGVGGGDKVRFSRQQEFPYYVDHAAGKGILYLPKKVQQSLLGKRELLIRPVSFADPRTMDVLKIRLKINIGATKEGLVYAYAFDDEISQGSFNNPIEVDIHPLTVTAYRLWLAQRYSSIENLNAAWGMRYMSFDAVEPVGFDDIRKNAHKLPFSQWNLSSWSEWRHFMDVQFAQVLAELTRYANSLDPNIPAGFVGGQFPSAYGGSDYALVSRAVQWMEANDFGEINEIARSFWNRPRRPHVQTFHTYQSHRLNVWRLWYRLAHGQQATIAWPEGWFKNDASGTRKLAPEIERLAPTFLEIQGAVSEFVLAPESYLETDAIGIYYSQASIRAVWAMDCVTHGDTWPNRTGAIENENSSSARLRYAWCALLEDCGFQYDFISYLDVEEGRIDLAQRFKVIILPQTICLSDRETEALRRFVLAGGVLIADSLCALLSETGRGRRAGALDDLFGVSRNEVLGYLNGKMITEVDAEQYQHPFPERLRAYGGALQYQAMIVYERGSKATKDAKGETVSGAQILIKKSTGRGCTLYLNLTPLAYSDFSFRSGAMGASWRKLILATLNDFGVQPRVSVTTSTGSIPWMESLLWRNSNRYCLALLMNAPEWIVASDGGGPSLLTMDISVKINLPLRNLRNIRSGQTFQDQQTFGDRFVPWEANFYEFNLAR